jgi:peptidoglycan/LPS O-acetylase OafA/YrhL
LRATCYFSLTKRRHNGTMLQVSPIGAKALPQDREVQAASHTHVPAVDGWRGLAIALVLAGHFLPLGNTGFLGVELFFVLSGRLMAQILVLRREPLGRFLKRRASRILPAYLAFLAAMWLIASTVVAPEDSADLAFGASAALLFFSNYWMTGDQLVILFNHSWSLAVEEHSYLLLALIVVLSGRRAGTILTIVAAAACAAMLNGLWQSLTYPSAGWLYVRTDIRLASIFISFALCLFLHRGRISAAVLPWLCPLALLGGAVLFLLSPWEPLRYTVATVLLALAVNTVEHMAAPLRRIVEDRVLRWLGLVSFSVYLWQQLFYVARLGGFPPILCFAGAVLCGAMSFYGIERPARRYFNAIGRSGQSSTSTC